MKLLMEFDKVYIMQVLALRDIILQQVSARDIFNNYLKRYNNYHPIEVGQEFQRPFKKQLKKWEKCILEQDIDIMDGSKLPIRLHDYTSKKRLTCFETVELYLGLEPMQAVERIIKDMKLKNN
jgi:predicted PolB exonuclease-like 3'-5' exonuclease